MAIACNAAYTQPIGSADVRDGIFKIRLPNLETLGGAFSIQLLDIGGVRLALEALPQGSVRAVNSNTVIKVLVGKLQWKERGELQVCKCHVRPRSFPLCLVFMPSLGARRSSSSLLMSCTLNQQR